MIDLTTLEPGDVVPSIEGPPGRFLGDDLCLVVIDGGLRVGRVDPTGPKPSTLTNVHDLEALAGSVVWNDLRKERA